jgi:hypothetical protein
MRLEVDLKRKFYASRCLYSNIFIYIYSYINHCHSECSTEHVRTTIIPIILITVKTSTISTMRLREGGYRKKNRLQIETVIALSTVEGIENRNGRVGIED